MRRRHIGQVCVLIGASSIFSLALAQESELKLEEVVVTAQKRAQNLQEVPLAVTAVSADALAAAGVRSVETLAQSVPGLVINNSNSLLLPFIRGVGAFNAGAATSSSVAIYIDGVYTPRANALAFSLDNIQQIEVLKGPQSTLYGRNATGGAITVTTATPHPGDDLSATVRGSYGNYDQRRASFNLAGGLGDKFAASLTGSLAQRDGNVDNLATRTFFGRGSTTGDLNSLDEKILNGKLTFAPTEATEFVLSGTYRHADDTANFTYKQFDGVNLVNNLGLDPATAGFLIATLPDGKYETYMHWGYRDTTDTSLTLSARIDFGGAYLVSISGYQKNDFEANTETFGLAVPFAGFAADWNTESLSQELRLHSSDESTVKWLLGATYFQEKDPKSRIWGTLGPAFAQQLFGAPFPDGLLAVNEDNPQINTDWKSTSYAVFGEVVYPVTDKFNLTAGVRNTWEKFELSDNRDPLIFGPLVVEPRDENWNETTYRFVADYTLDWGMVYGSYSRGFVSGGLNVQNPGGDVVDPEKLDAFEIGLKSDLADGRVRLNAAVFDYNYKDIHAQSINGGTGLTNLVTGQKATIRGMDLDIDTAVLSNLTAKLGLTYLFDRKYDEFEVPETGVPGTSSFFPAVNATGNIIAGAPELTALLGLEHNLQVGSGHISTNVNFNYNSGVFYDITETIGSDGLGDDDYTLVNVNSTYHSADDRWSVGVWVNNAFDTYYVAGGVNSTGSIIGIEGLPRMYGVSVSFSMR